MSSSPVPPSDDGQHPLDAREAYEFARIVQGFHRTAGPRHKGLETPRLRWQTVVLVLTASSVFALISTQLPPPANLWSPVGLLVAVAITSLASAVRAANHGSGRDHV